MCRKCKDVISERDKEYIDGYSQTTHINYMAVRRCKTTEPETIKSKKFEITQCAYRDGWETLTDYPNDT